MAAAGHWCNQAAGLVASSLKTVAPEQTAMRWRPAVWSGTVLAAQDRGLEQRWPLTGSVSVLDVARQPAGALGAGMQRVPVHVLFRCTTVGGKGRGVVYAPYIFTLAHLQERDV